MAKILSVPARGEGASKLEENITVSRTDLSNEERPIDDNLQQRAYPKRRWYQWYADTDTPLERKLLLKIDLLILIYAFLGFWVKRIDQANLNNAYVSGLKEDLGFYANELVQLQTVYTVGYTVFMIPTTLLAAKFRHIVPACDLLWGVFTLLQYRASSFSELAAYRFLIGAFESVFFSAIHYVLGSWYRPDELTRRAGIFYLSSCLGLMSTGFMASSVVKNLSGINGLAGWRWLFIVCGIVTIVISIYGFFFFPNTPQKTKSWFLTEDEKQLAYERMRRIGTKPPIGFGGWKAIKRFLGRWHFWALVLNNLPWQWSEFPSANGAYILWISGLKRFTASEVNLYSTINPGVGVFLVILYSWLSDLFPSSKIYIIVGQSIFQFAMQLAFVIPGTPENYKWAALSTGFGQAGSLSPLIYSWANEICRDDAEERAFVIASMVAVLNSFSAWNPLLVWPTVEAPTYRKGYIFTQVNIGIFIFTSLTLWWWYKRDERKRLHRVNAA